ncbi:MAG: tetratricopeptide repeat protein [bacterium]|nr:MAG: tetratricopeptide repeat protein [bacterium]
MNQNVVDLQRDVINASFKQPIVIDFWAEWCAPCRMLGPILEKLANQANGRWRLVKINTELQPDIAMQFGISSIPAVKMVSEGEIIAEFVGALPEPQVLKWLDENLPTKSKSALQNAIEALEHGDVNKAKQLLKYAIDQDDTNLDAKVMLARLMFIDNPDKALKLTESVDEAHSMFDQVEAMQTLHRLSNSAKDLLKEAQKHNTEAWNLYAKGINAFKKNDYGTALESWIDSIIIDRQVDDDGARKACVALFKILGNEHKLTKKYHRRFSSTLF